MLSSCEKQAMSTRADIFSLPSCAAWEDRADISLCLWVLLHLAWAPRQLLSVGKRTGLGRYCWEMEVVTETEVWSFPHQKTSSRQDRPRDKSCSSFGACMFPGGPGHHCACELQRGGLMQK